MVLQDSFARLQCETINTNNQLGVTTMIKVKCKCGKPMQISLEKMNVINHYNNGEIICRDCLIKKLKEANK